ncbi:unnamed protein product [Caenorhabditis sp. 36 PRJEB53466]|nr:unnamed protein product [Caenorhabditis sp. 36 PRJEB53466]
MMQVRSNKHKVSQTFAMDGNYVNLGDIQAAANKPHGGETYMNLKDFGPAPPPPPPPPPARTPPNPLTPRRHRPVTSASPSYFTPPKRRPVTPPPARTPRNHLTPPRKHELSPAPSPAPALAVSPKKHKKHRPPPSPSPAHSQVQSHPESVPSTAAATPKSSVASTFGESAPTKPPHHRKMASEVSVWGNDSEHKKEAANVVCWIRAIHGVFFVLFMLCLAAWLLTTLVSLHYIELEFIENKFMELGDE